jgi:hypothetical protein
MIRENRCVSASQCLTVLKSLTNVQSEQLSRQEQLDTQRHVTLRNARGLKGAARRKLIFFVSKIGAGQRLDDRARRTAHSNKTFKNSKQALEAKGGSTKVRHSQSNSSSAQN